MSEPDRKKYRNAIGKVRDLLERCGGAEGVSRRDLGDCSADLLVVKRTAERLGQPDSPLCQLFQLSEDVEALLRRMVGLAPEERTPRDHAAPTSLQGTSAA